MVLTMTHHEELVSAKHVLKVSSTRKSFPLLVGNRLRNYLKLSIVMLRENFNTMKRRIRNPPQEEDSNTVLSRSSRVSRKPDYFRVRYTVADTSGDPTSLKDTLARSDETM